VERESTSRKIGHTNINMENLSFIGDSDTNRSYLEIKKSAYEAGTAERKALNG